MVLIFNVARPVVEFIRIHTTESVGPPPQERMLGRDLAGTDVTLCAAVFPARASSTQAVGLFLRLRSRTLDSAPALRPCTPPLQLPACPHVLLTHGDAEMPRPRSFFG